MTLADTSFRSALVSIQLGCDRTLALEEPPAREDDRYSPAAASSAKNVWWAVENLTGVGQVRDPAQMGLRSGGTWRAMSMMPSSCVVLRGETITMEVEIIYMYIYI